MINEIAFGVAHAVVQHTARAHHPWNRVDAAFNAIWRKRTRAFTVPIFLVKFLAISETTSNIRIEMNNLWWSVDSPTPQSSLYHRILLNYRFWYIECCPFLQAACGVASQHRRYGILGQRIVIVVNGRASQLHVGIIIGWNHWRLWYRIGSRMMAAGIGVVGIVGCELTRYVLNVEFLWRMLER